MYDCMNIPVYGIRCVFSCARALHVLCRWGSEGEFLFELFVFCQLVFPSARALHVLCRWDMEGESEGGPTAAAASSPTPPQ